MKIETVEITSLTLDPENARTHSQKNIDAIAGSLTTFGQRRPLVVWGDIVIAGNGTMEAAKSIGWEKIDITRVPTDWTHDQARAYALADNRTAELAEWDSESLLDILAGLNDELVTATGFTSEEIEDLNKIWGEPPNLDDLAEDFSNIDNESGLIKITFKVDPDIAAMWNSILIATGISDSDAAVESMIRAAYEGIKSSE
jgi:hypothetical protein